MRVEISRVGSGDPMVIFVDGDETTVKAVFSAATTGRLLNHPELSLVEAARISFGNDLSNLGNLRVCGDNANLDTVVHDGDTIFIVPKIDGGR